MTKSWYGYQYLNIDKDVTTLLQMTLLTLIFLKTLTNYY